MNTTLTASPVVTAPTRPRPTLLVVDDEQGPRQSLHMVFKEDYQVLLAEAGPKALELAREHDIDAAVLDIRMPGMSGVEVLARLKEINPTVEVVMLTAYETIETARQALRLGACDYLTKPFDLATMRAAVANAMERHALGEQIRSNNRRLRDLQDQLCNQKLEEEIIRTRGEIYASVIHDINGPLTIISGFIDIINRHITGSTTLEGGSLELVKDRLCRVTRQVNNCIDISQRYLGFLRKKPAERLAVGLRQVLADLKELLHVHGSMQKNKLTVELPDDDLQVRVNGAELIQILLNLTINALQCSPEPHSVAVSSKLLERPPDFASLPDTDGSRLINREGVDTGIPFVALVVEDDGPGIRADVLPRIFQPGFSTKAIDDKGTGYGLSVVLRLVASYKGAVHVQTHPASGTRFTLYLPAVV